MRGRGVGGILGLVLRVERNTIFLKLLPISNDEGMTLFFEYAEQPAGFAMFRR